MLSEGAKPEGDGVTFQQLTAGHFGLVILEIRNQIDQVTGKRALRTLWP
jgi:hypothetical protein